MSRNNQYISTHCIFSLYILYVFQCILKKRNNAQIKKVAILQNSYLTKHWNINPNKFVLLFEETKDKETEHQIENILHMLDNRVPFAGLINSTCILGSVYTKPADFGKSYQEAKNLIPKK